jgi:hypothetical protein
MESTPRLYDKLVEVLRQHQNWVDLRHLKTLTWMVVGLMQAGKISLTAWAPYVWSIHEPSIRIWTDHSAKPSTRCR